MFRAALGRIRTMIDDLLADSGQSFEQRQTTLANRNHVTLYPVLWHLNYLDDPLCAGLFDTHPAHAPERGG